MYKFNLEADTKLNNTLDNGISSFENNRPFYLELKIYFHDGSSIVIWNSNKYYAWVSDIRFYKPNKIHPIQYNRIKVRRKTLWRLRKAIDNHEVNLIKHKELEAFKISRRESSMTPPDDIIPLI